jgi:predicted RNA methylase
MEKKQFTAAEEMELIGRGLDTALQFGLEVEVIYQALLAMKKDPTISPVEAMVFSVAEWVK